MMEQENQSPGKETEMVTEAISDFDPLEALGKEQGEAMQNDLEPKEERLEKNAEKELEKTEKKLETLLEREVEEIEEASEKTLENVEKIPEKGIEKLENAEKTATEPAVAKEEMDSDPLGKMAEQDQIKEPLIQSKKELSQDYKNKLEEWGKTGLDFLDEMKVNLCVAIGGGQKSEYAADKKVKKMFFEATQELLKSKELKAPTPTQAFLLALAMMIGPSLGLAAFRKYTQPDLENRVLPEKAAASTVPQAQTDYRSTKEYQKGRTRFKVHANGSYLYNTEGEYTEVKYAEDYPSPEVQKLIDEGKKSSEIKNIIYA
ncbi:hypothetical protein [Aureispira anguillae]|uniref:Uncharacterized protein n=1 Tax=Aureispira anguillae TaxID=2864201 RepID=A0A915YGK0_9BACT|nr:hypothetical protein [Aureispira anguillae]BDS12755.1 hypothetical protein AsAng_0034800 [Aureispira anguillae]